MSVWVNKSKGDIYLFYNGVDKSLEAPYCQKQILDEK